MVRSRRSLWFFVLLLVLGAVAVAAPIVYNLRLQLTPAQLADAEARWRQHGPSDYDLEYVQRIDDEPPGPNYRIRVRGGKVVDVRRGGKPAPPSEFPASEWQAYSVPGLFGQIQAYFAEDERARRRNYATAFFDRHTGYPLRYIHRVRGSHQRLEWNVKLLPAD